MELVDCEDDETRSYEVFCFVAVHDNSHYDLKGDYIPEYRAFWTSPKQMKREFHDDALQDCLEWLDEEYTKEDI